jgi:nucleoside-diphosphate-sugar epimerase
MSNLIIGNTSQLSPYFPAEYDRISSRNVDIEVIKNKRYDTIYLLFAEQRTFLNQTVEFFLDINVRYTLHLINALKESCNRIIIYSTSELWNNYNGPVSLDMNYNFNHTPYIKSKELLCNHINYNKADYQNVHIVYPFNFNSPYRKPGFLFSKIFDSLINKVPVTVGDLNFSRDLVHPSVIVEHSIAAKDDVIVGTGELINVEAYVKDLFLLANMDYNRYIVKDNANNLPNVRKDYYAKHPCSNYQSLLKLTLNDIQQNYTN